jgi:anti-sigma-K factor RskA
MSAAKNTTTPLHTNIGPDVRLDDSAVVVKEVVQVQDTSTSTSEADTKKRYRHVLRGLQTKAIIAFRLMFEDSAEKEMREELWNSNPLLRRFRLMIAHSAVLALPSTLSR